MILFYYVLIHFLNIFSSFHDRKPAVQTHQTMIIEEFEPDVFRQLIEYIHTGCVTLQARTLLGKNVVLNIFLRFQKKNFVNYSWEQFIRL